MLQKIEYKYIVAIIYTFVLFLDRLDVTIVNIAFPAIANDFHIPVTQTEWIANAFLLALAISIPVSGWIGDRFGIRNVFIFATGLFGFSALLCAFSHSFTLMVFLRFTQGLGGGILIPVGMTMLYRVFEPREYASITTISFVTALIAPAISPALGGIIIHYLSWHWIFILSATLCLFAVFLSILTLRKIETKVLYPLDWAGFMQISIALVLMLYFLSDFGHNGISIKTEILSCLTILLIYFFIRNESKVKYPLINLSLFSNKLFTQINLIQLAFQMCHYASFFVIGLYLQVGLHISALQAGIIIGMQALGAMSINGVTNACFNRLGPGKTIIIGFVGIIILTACLLFIDKGNIFYLGCGIMYLRGLFSGLCGMPMQISSVLGFEKSQLGQASAVFNAGRQVSITLGIAISSFVLTIGLKQHPGSPYAFYSAFYLIMATALIGIGLANMIDNKKALWMLGNQSTV